MPVQLAIYLRHSRILFDHNLYSSDVSPRNRGSRPSRTGIIFNRNFPSLKSINPPKTVCIEMVWGPYIPHNSLNICFESILRSRRNALQWSASTAVLKLVLRDQNLTLNSDAGSTFTHMCKGLVPVNTGLSPSPSHQQFYCWPFPGGASIAVPLARFPCVLIFCMARMYTGQNYFPARFCPCSIDFDRAACHMNLSED